MKGINYVLVAVLSMLFACIVSYVLLLEKNPFTGESLTTKTVDEEELIPPQSVSPIDVSYSKPYDIVNAQEEYQSIHRVDSIFNSMSMTAVYNVAKVIIEKHGTCTIRKLVDEYMKNKDIYDPLSSESSNITSTAELISKDAHMERPRDKLRQEDSANIDEVSYKLVKIEK